MIKGLRYYVYPTFTRRRYYPTTLLLLLRDGGTPVGVRVGFSPAWDPAVVSV